MPTSPLQQHIPTSLSPLCSLCIHNLLALYDLLFPRCQCLLSLFLSHLSFFLFTLLSLLFLLKFNNTGRPSPMSLPFPFCPFWFLKRLAAHKEPCDTPCLRYWLPAALSFSTGNFGLSAQRCEGKQVARLLVLSLVPF